MSRGLSSVGSGQTAYNFNIPASGGDAVIVGVYENGDVWTDISRIGPDPAARLASALSKIGIILDCNKIWTFWKMADSKLNLSLADPLAIAQSVRFAIDFGNSASA